MNADNHHDPLPSAAQPEWIESVPVPDEPATMHRLRDALRGRYPLAISLALVGAVVGGLGAFFAIAKSYESYSLVRIRQFLPIVIKPTETQDLTSTYQSFVNSQIELIQSQHVADMAQRDETWLEVRKIARETPTLDPLEFQRRLHVDNPGHSEYIRVAFSDGNPKAALAMVRAIVDRYYKLYDERDVKEWSVRLNLLEERQRALNSDLTSKNQGILRLGEQYGTTSLDYIYNFKIDQVNKIEAALKETQVEAAMRGISAAATQPAAAAATQPSGAPRSAAPESEMSVDDIGLRDTWMRGLLGDKSGAEARLRRLDFMGPKNRLKIEAIKDLDVIQAAIDAYADQYRHNRRAIPGAAPGADDSLGLRIRIQELTMLLDSARREAQDIGRHKLDIDKLRQDAATIIENLKETRDRLDVLNTAAPVSKRIETIKEDDGVTIYATDPTPTNLGVRRQATVLSSVGGAILGFAIVAVIGLLDPRLRYAAEARNTARLLGVLPLLPEDLSAPDQADAASQCVHQIRTLLQLEGHDHDRRVLAITSPSPSSGKTSLSLALGLAFAASGTRTLLIDCDFIGAGLSQRLEAFVRRRIGQILVRQHLLEPAQLEKALEKARRSGHRLGDTLVEMNLLKADDLRHALDLQERSQVGVPDVLAGEALDDCLADTGVPGLSILPVATARYQDMSRLAPSAARRLLTQARTKFDCVILDTGSVPGSASTAAFAAEADQVILVVARGDQRPATEAAVSFLHSMGARLAGLVFNRATDRDVASLVASSSHAPFSTTASGNGTPAPVPAPASDARRFGLLGHAVVGPGAAQRPEPKK